MGVMLRVVLTVSILVLSVGAGATVAQSANYSFEYAMTNDGGGGSTSSRFSAVTSIQFSGVILMNTSSARYQVIPVVSSEPVSAASDWTLY